MAKRKALFGVNNFVKKKKRKVYFGQEVQNSLYFGLLNKG